MAGIPAEHRLDLGDMLVRNVTTDTRGPFGEGAQRDGNSIFIFEAAGLCIGHLGHLHQIPSRTICRDRAGRHRDGAGRRRLYHAAGHGRGGAAAARLGGDPDALVFPGSLGEFLQEMAGEFDVVETGLNRR
jgi:hypothetical protein